MSTATYYLPVQDDIRLVEERILSQADGYHPDLATALRHLLSSGGKRVRPTVALLVGRMLGAEADQLVTLAAAIELLHTATLVHDDLIDSALLRRGIPTLNARWTPAATILTGDFLFARSAALAAEIKSVEVMRLFAKTLAIIVNGEITQLFSGRSLVNREDYFRRIYAKTASLFETASLSAALLSPAKREVIEAARRFGYEIGLAFQIVDDVLDFTGEQATMGKPVGSDLRQGLITLPAIIYLEAHPTDRQCLLEGDHRDAAQLEALITAISESSAIAYSLAEATHFVERSLAALSELPATSERASLEELARYIVERRL